jgi:hypothetical protein
MCLFEWCCFNQVSIRKPNLCLTWMGKLELSITIWSKTCWYLSWHFWVSKRSRGCIISRIALIQKKKVKLLVSRRRIIFYFYHFFIWSHLKRALVEAFIYRSWRSLTSSIIDYQILSSHRPDTLDMVSPQWEIIDAFGSAPYSFPHQDGNMFLIRYCFKTSANTNPQLSSS